LSTKRRYLREDRGESRVGTVGDLLAQVIQRQKSGICPDDERIFSRGWYVKTYPVLFLLEFEKCEEILHAFVV